LRPCSDSEHRRKREPEAPQALSDELAVLRALLLAVERNLGDLVERTCLIE
jgi:hypothetical protein